MFWSYVLSILLLGCGCLLMFIVLLQRGRGGGLAGAFGGAGGQSALGTRAGDVFTKITVVLAAIWVVLSGVTGLVMQNEQTGRFPGGSAAAAEEPGMSSAGDEAEDGADTPEGAAPVDGTGEADGTSGDAAADDDGPALIPPTSPATGDAGSDEEGSGEGTDAAPGETPESESPAP